MINILSWVKYHTITSFKRHYAHKLYKERVSALNGLIRVVINFDEKKNGLYATIRYREFIIAELDKESMDHASEMLCVLRKLNRHTIY